MAVREGKDKESDSFRMEANILYEMRRVVCAYDKSCVTDGSRLLCPTLDGLIASTLSDMISWQHGQL